MKAKIAILGGGLAGGLTALYLKKSGFTDFVLHEKSDSFGGDHTWSFLSSDVSTDDLEFLAPMIKQSWKSHQIIGPNEHRNVPVGYHSIRSKNFNEFIQQNLDSENINLNCEDIEFTKDQLVLDATGSTNSSFGPSGYQKFVGADVVYKTKHNLANPIIMDFSVPQLGGYRFIYCLPFSEKEILIEDTRYTNDPFIDRKSYELKIQDYAEKFGEVESLGRIEQAALAIPLTKEMFQSHLSTPLNRICIGLKGGLFHPVTGYSFPMALSVAKFIGNNAHLTSKQLASSINIMVNSWKRNCRFYFLLNRMLFGAAKPDERYKIFEHFYRLSDDTVSRFYQGKMSAWDKVKILSGKPPVPVNQAIKSLITDSWMDPAKG